MSSFSGHNSNIKYNDIYILYGDAKNKFSIKNLFSTLIVKESILEYFCFGAVIFRDEAKAFSKYAFTGDEDLVVDFVDEAEGKQHILQFKITACSLSDLESNSPNQTVTLSISDWYYKKFFLEMSTSFKDKTISDFISNMCEKNMGFKLARVEKTKEQFSFAFPYERFIDMVAYLNSFAISETNSTNYIFWTDFYSANYVTLNYLMDPKNNVILQFNEVSPARRQNELFGFYEYSYSRQALDRGSFYGRGGPGSTVYSFDPETKSAVSYPVKYSDVMKTQNGLAKYLPMEKEVDNAKNKNYYSPVRDYELLENNIINQNNQNSILFSITTIGTMLVRPGFLANVSFKDPINTEEPFDKNWSGLYLIKTINHVFERNAYNQQITFMNNGYQFPQIFNTTVAFNKSSPPQGYK